MLWHSLLSPWWDSTSASSCNQLSRMRWASRFDPWYVSGRHRTILDKLAQYDIHLVFENLAAVENECSGCIADSCSAGRNCWVESCPDGTMRIGMQSSWLDSNCPDCRSKIRWQVFQPYSWSPHERLSEAVKKIISTCLFFPLRVQQPLSLANFLLPKPPSPPPVVSDSSCFSSHIFRPRGNALCNRLTSIFSQMYGSTLSALSKQASFKPGTVKKNSQETIKP